MTVNIHEAVATICEQLGLEPYTVRRMEITPTSVVAQIYVLRDGVKYVDETGEPVVETKTYEVMA